jgi:LCP family protein required for cell wall assembly
VRYSTTTRLPFLLVFALVAAACSGGSDGVADTTSTVPTTAATTTTQKTTTTEAGPKTVTLGFEMPDEIAAPLDEFYSWLVDDRNPKPKAPADLLSHVTGLNRSDAGATGDVTSADLESGDRVAIARVDADVLALVDDGSGWRIVGAAMDGTTPWFGSEPRMVLVIGSDARPGENQQTFRADSVHIVTVVPSKGAGAILGFPRDSWVEGPDGMNKLTNHMAGVGPTVIYDIITGLTDLPLEGYFVTGFRGFDNLVTALGGLTIDLPTKMRSGNNWDNFPAGEQTLNPTRALQLARIRKGLPRGDFDRSVNQGRIMQAAMTMIQDAGVAMLPQWTKTLLDNVWTDLSTEDVLTLAASIYFFNADQLANTVVPGTVGTAGSASVVYISDSAEEIYRDLDDGLLDTTSTDQ